ncbi:hypothetical protein WG66_009732 [Moniliophthora roreri]|nr:hypothetical protein WG66_009732 [Moniliophthora roreri]
MPSYLFIHTRHIYLALVPIFKTTMFDESICGKLPCITLQGASVILCILSLLYGVYTVLFSTCIFILVKQKHNRYIVHCLVMSALFILATAGFVFNARDIINQLLWEVAGLTKVLDLNSPIVAPMTARSKINLLDSIIADAILIWRCYIIWGRNIRVIIIPTLLCIANNVLGIVVIIRYSKDIGIGISATVLQPYRGDKALRIIPAFLFMTALTNLLITFLIAARIYVISRRAAKYVGKNVNRMYRTVISIVLESGLIYPLVLIVYASSGLTVFSSLIMLQSHPVSLEVQKRMQLLAVLLQSTLNQFVGIAPTLIIVRIGLGISVESVEQTVSAMRAAAVTESKQFTKSIVDIS